MLETLAATNHLGRVDSIHKNGDSGDGVLLGLNQLNIVKPLFFFAWDFLFDGYEHRRYLGVNGNFIGINAAS